MNALLLKSALIGAVGWAYNVAVGIYADWRVRRMQSIPLISAVNNDGPSNADTCTVSVSELRRTVNRRTGLVENLNDRRQWNRWLSAPPSSSRATDGLVPGKYVFTYRSYVNFEETGAIKKSLMHVPTLLGYIQNERGTMVVNSDGKHVSITDRFLFRLTQPVAITWNGILKDGGRQIEWTDTELKKGRKKKQQCIRNPKEAERLRTTPWDVVKVEDGMAVFRRGTIGMLVYDLQATKAQPKP